MKGLGGVIKASTQLTAQKKVLTPEGLEMIASGADIQELTRTRPELWQPKGKARVVNDKVVTDAYVALLVDDLQASQAAHSTFSFHDSGTGTVAEAAGDTTLGTACGEARDDGTQVEGATANIYKSVATHTYAGTFAITEHGLFSALTGGTLMDRTVFSAINVVADNQIEFTFEITFSSGG